MKHFGPIDLIERALVNTLETLPFGEPLGRYRQLGSVDRASEWDYDYEAISECRHCGGLTVTGAQEEDGLLIPMTAGRGPNCKHEKCGDKVSAGCLGVFRVRKVPRRYTASRC